MLLTSLCLLGSQQAASAADVYNFTIKRAKSFRAWTKKAWDTPPLTKNFILPKSGKRPAPSAGGDAEVHAAFTKTGIAFAIRCPEPNTKKISARLGPEHHDRNLPRTDDCIEVLIDPNRDGEQAFCIAVNSKGAVLDGVFRPVGFLDTEWESRAKPKVTVSAKSWTVVMEVPFSALGMKLSPGDIIGLGFDRVRHAGGKQQLTVWPGKKTYWSWRQRRSIPDPFFFASVLLEPAQNDLTFISTTRGALKKAGHPRENNFGGFFRNNGSVKRKYRFQASLKTKKGTKVFYTTEGTLPPGGVHPVNCVYPGGEIKPRFIAFSGHKQIYNSSASRTLDMPPRIHDLRGAFDETLVETRADAPSRDGYIIFPLHLDDKMNVWLGLAHAYESSLEQLVRQAAANKEIPFTTVRDDNNYNDLKSRAKIFRKYGVKALFCPDIFRFPNPGGYSKTPFLVKVKKHSKPNSRYAYRPLPCEGTKRAHFRAMKEGFSQYKDLIWGVFVADELDASMMKALKAANATNATRARHPAIVTIDRDIRKRFGDGKYGLANPRTPEADLPLCTIATKRWLNDWIAQFEKEAAECARKLKPGVYVVSDDPQGQVFPYDYRNRWRPMDIAMHQTHDKAIPEDLGTAVITKFVRDTSAVREFWPCVHAEGTSAVYSVDEMREVMSRAFRNGATGISFFNTNWGGSLGRSENFYAIERWDYLNELAAFYAKGSRARLPAKARVGAFYSGYSAMASYSRGVGSVYNYLGPGSGAYFKFIDNFSIERGEIDPGDYEVIFVYHALYESPKVVQKLIEAVREKGVTLIITDAEAFSHSPLGSALKERQELLGGIEFGPVQRRELQVFSGPDAKGPLKAVKEMRVRSPRNLKAPANMKILLRYKDKTPACVVHKLGKGKVLWFGFNPFFGITRMVLTPDAPTGFDYGDKAIVDPLVVKANPTTEYFFKLLLRTFNIPLDEKIWKLKLPEPGKRSYWPEGQVCLSGNSIQWSLSRPRTVFNLPTLGGYRYSVQPARKEKADSRGWIPFATGILTDRVNALRESKSIKDSFLAWKDTKAFNIEMDLGFAANVDNLRLFVTGEIPVCRLSASLDGKKWFSHSQSKAKKSTKDIHKIKLSANGKRARFLRIEISKRTKGGELTIAEVDVWGKMEAETIKP